MNMLTKKMILLFCCFVLASGCAEDSKDINKPDDVPDYRVELKDFSDKAKFEQLLNGPWKVLTENDREVENTYLEFNFSEGTYTETGEAGFSTSIEKTTRNEYGYELELEGHSPAIRLIHLDHDTLYYTSAELSPHTAWTAKRAESSDYIYESLDNSFDELLTGAECLPKAVTGEVDHITGVWKLVKVAGVDMSCGNILYDFQASGELVITNDTDAIASGNHRYSYTDYPFCPLCVYLQEPIANLTIDGTGVYCEVLKRKMFIFDSKSKGMRERHKIFVRVE
jgi:hypothetical protein